MLLQIPSPRILELPQPPQISPRISPPHRSPQVLLGSSGILNVLPPHTPSQLPQDLPVPQTPPSQILGDLGRVSPGGPDPALNAQLANVVEQCRAKNMPKASIEAAIHGERSAAASRLLYEARGPGGSALLLEVLTDNPRRSQQDVRLILTRHGGTMAEGARHGFEQKGVVRVGPRDLRGHPVSLEAALEAALEAGAQDVCLDEEEEEEEEEEPALKFICETSALRTVRERLEAAGLRPLSAAIEYLPRDRVALPEGTREQAERLLQALSDCPDVVHLYHNIQ
uniref:Translational activator of cytochrome c oxidase I n=1 Tax=Otus sunia TaxID=257818 RepID=A0A8C8ANK2_9STRI